MAKPPPPADVVQRAFELFIKGDVTFGKISDTLEIEFETRYAPGTIAQWARENDWASKREKTADKALEVVANTEVKRRTFDLEKDFNDLEKIREKALEELDLHTFKDAGQAANAIQRTIEQERKIMSGILSAQLVKEVVNIIQEEVKDSELRNKIGQRLRTLVEALDNVGKE